MTFRTMRIMRRRTGYTLADLIITLSLLGIVLGTAAPRAIALRSRVAVRSARDATASAIERAKSLAIARGTARITVDPVAGTITTESPVGVIAAPVLRVRDGFGVTLNAGSAGRPVSLDFNALGLGQVASRTLSFGHGSVTAGISISSFGRVRRW
jgi:Tfp pilus assembly protein FimT